MHQSLAQKMTHLLCESDALISQGVTPNFGMLRGLLGKHRILILPHIKNQHEVTIPHSSPERARATVIVEITLVDAENAEQLSSRWIGQAEGAPMLATEQAINHAMEDFLQKTFLVLEPASPQTSAIRRQPQGAPPEAPIAQPPVAPATPASSSAQQADQLDLLDLSKAANEDAPSDPLPPLTKEWKSANALWRALVNEVSGSEVMDALEDAIERHHNADSWRRLTPAQIRTECAQLKKRSALPPDIRKMSDREEYILSKLPFIPAGSSLNRLHSEIARLTGAVVSQDTADAFLALYLSKMNADALSEVPGKAVIALTRKMRRLRGEQREAFVVQALEAAQGDRTDAA